MVISWILTSVAENIKKSIMFMNKAKQIWKQLENRYSITNGAKKCTLNDHKEELKLFQFLNVLDEEYSSQRSQILMLRILPSVDEACNMLQQEESQRVILKQGKEENDRIAMHTKRGDLACGKCEKLDMPLRSVGLVRHVESKDTLVKSVGP
ncbi:Dihydroxy-acid dehydratase [Bienertia sinuspersici]